MWSHKSVSKIIYKCYTVKPPLTATFLGGQFIHSLLFKPDSTTATFFCPKGGRCPALFRGSTVCTFSARTMVVNVRKSHAMLNSDISFTHSRIFLTNTLQNYDWQSKHLHFECYSTMPMLIFQVWLPVISSPKIQLTFTFFASIITLTDLSAL